MFKKLFSIIIGLVVVGGLAFGGYYLFKNVINKQVGEFQIQYSHEKYMENYETYYNFVKGYTGKPIENVVIAETFSQDSVTYYTNAIRAKAFKNNKTMISIEVPENFILLEGNVFSGCDNLRTITLKCIELDTVNVFTSFNRFLDGLTPSNITFKVMNNNVKTVIDNLSLGVNVETMNA